ncbi:MAG: redoxin family protein [Thermoguttaceae bacterium]
MCVRFWNVVALAVLLVAPAAAAEDAYYWVALRDLRLTEGSLPTELTQGPWGRIRNGQAMQPYAVLDVEGEAFVGLEEYPFSRRSIGATGPAAEPAAGQADAKMPLALRDPAGIAIRAPGGKDVTGRLYVPKSDWNGMEVLKFTIPASAASSDNRWAFYRAKQAHYNRLLRRGIPGGAWFRHQARQARMALGETTDQPERFEGPRPGPDWELQRTYALFTGGRAISENLQLERFLPPPRAGSSAATVAVDSIPGIAVREFDWAPLVKEIHPELDPLASKIPADQHVVFFPSVEAGVSLSELLAQQGTVFLRLAEPRSEEGGTFARYERQLCLSLDVARLLGSKFAKSVALTGSDPYFPTGTDVAILLESAEPAALANALWAQIGLLAAGAPEAKWVQGEADGLAYRGLRSPDRSVSSYVARLDGAVVVTNSLYQLGRLASVKKGDCPSIASLPEYKFFRNRYRRGEPEETAFVFLSDATIRRWCGPRWRIGASRRLREAAVMAELQAAYLDRLARGKVEPGPIRDLPFATTGDWALLPSGVFSPTAGTLGFITPIAELSMDQVTEAEALAYQLWRDGYQRNWTWAFDPIALRISAGKDVASADLTILPLIWATRYRELISISQGAQIRPDAGDRHKALAHAILALNTKSETVQRYGHIARMLVRDLKMDPLSWLGQSVSIYVDDDPFWEELAKAPSKEPQREQFLQKQLGRLPIAVQAEVSSGTRLAVFLTALRAFVEQTAPDMTQWESLTYKGEPYVKVSPTERARARERDLEEMGPLAVYYAASGDTLVVTLSESVLKRAIDRQLARREAKPGGKPAAVPPRPWLGSNVGFQAERKAVEALVALVRDEYQAMMQARAWGNLPILNEWRRRYPGQDPVGFHHRYWQARLVCPGGGKYVWNQRYQTYESTVYGHPGEPKSGPALPPALGLYKAGNFGLTFENQGLRARVVLERAEAFKLAGPEAAGQVRARPVAWQGGGEKAPKGKPLPDPASLPHERKPPEPAKPEPPRVRYEVPEGGTAELVKFINQLQAFRPKTLEEYAQYRSKGQAALTEAAQRILKLETDKSSAASQLARTILLQGRISKLAEATAAQQRAVLEELEELLLAKAENLTAQDASMALSVSRVLELGGHQALAEEAYRRMGAVLANSKDEKLVELGKMMEGAARRLGLVGKPLELAGTKMDGTPLDWASYRGKVVLVDFWATWCGPCRAELPRVKKHYENYHDRGFEVVGISVDRDRQALEQFLENQPLPWPTLHEKQLQGRSPLATYYGVMAIPTVFLVDREGKVVSIRARGDELASLLEKLIGPPHIPRGKLVFADLQPKANWRLAQGQPDDPDNHLGQLAPGEQTLEGVRYRIGESMIQLGNKFLPDAPLKVEGIELDARAAKLYILHAARWCGEDWEVPDGTLVAQYRVRYEDGSQQVIPVVSGEDLRDWWNHDQGKPTKRGRVVWTGSNPAVRNANLSLRLYQTVWENPQPHKKVLCLDYLSAKTTAAPFCVAITAEEPGQPAAAAPKPER